MPETRPPGSTRALGRAFSLRLGLWYALLFLAGGASLLGLTYALLEASLRERDRELVTSALEQYVGQYRDGGLESLSAAVAQDRMAGRNEGLVVRLTGTGGQAVFATVPSSWEATGFEVASVRLPEGILFEVGKSSEARADILARFRARAALAFVAVVLLGGAGGALLTRKALAPLRRLRAVLGGIVRTGQVSARVPVRSDGDPLDDLGQLANEMLDRIEALIAGMKGSLDNVAHDLRTPLQRLRATAESALRENDPEAGRVALAACIEECDRVAATLTALMDISEAETGTMALRAEDLDVASLLRETAELYEVTAEDKGIALTTDAPSDLQVRGDRARLRQALANLTDNAVKYTPRGGHVWLRARREGSQVVLESADDGPGIAPEDLPHVFDRLYRSDRSRSERGLGLGLSLVRAIARAHGGEATVSSSPGAGATFRLSLSLTPL
ncbi:MAG TPA: HAMP domain-containing sensor histidine kinase [Vicinamibacteria bacterium]|nr:HAMP domain-containing sensor histidine kinase [Vicinamibacteria bacterium]